MHGYRLKKIIVELHNLLARWHLLGRSLSIAVEKKFCSLNHLYRSVKHLQIDKIVSVESQHNISLTLESMCMPRTVRIAKGKCKQRNL